MRGVKGPVGVYNTLPCERVEGTCRGVPHITLSERGDGTCRGVPHITLCEG